MKRVDSDSDREDHEVMEVKRAMKEARARKKSLESKLKGQLTRDAQEKLESDVIIKSLREEVDALKSELSDAKYDLKQAKFEVKQLQSKCTKLNEEKQLLETLHRSQQLELQLKMETALKQNEEKSKLVSIESEKLSRLTEKLLRDISTETKSSLVLRTHLHLLEKIASGINKVIEVNTGITPTSVSDLKISLSLSENDKTTVNSSIDTALLDMCRNLEEENVNLSDTIIDLKNQLAEAKRESAASKLIPHYRLAVMRAKTHADNLTEQVQRERQTSEELREQLNETYNDLKKVVEEKRKLYKRLGKLPLEDDEKLLKRGVQISIHPKPESRSSSPAVLRSNRSKVRPSDSACDIRGAESIVDKAVLESSLRGDLKDLDTQIELIKEQLEKAAVLQSRKILSDVLDHSVRTNSYFD